MLYSLLGGGGATVLPPLPATASPGSSFAAPRAFFALIIAALLVPMTAVTLPLYLVYAKAAPDQLDPGA